MKRMIILAMISFGSLTCAAEQTAKPKNCQEFLNTLYKQYLPGFYKSYDELIQFNEKQVGFVENYVHRSSAEQTKTKDSFLKGLSDEKNSLANYRQKIESDKSGLEASRQLGIKLCTSPF